MTCVSIFGATGSVGLACADVIALHPDHFSIDTLTADSQWQKLADMAVRLRAKRVVISNDAYYSDLKQALSGQGMDVHAGRDALIAAAGETVDIHVAAIVGMAGLEPMMAALRAAKNVAIANKEPLVAAGALVMQTAAHHQCRLLPLDSEHNAVFQVFENHNRAAIEKIILTASGGPFREAAPEQMRLATPKQALAHPNWSMGRKISIDSATMMNKALEVIEAHHLFAMPPEKIEVVVHPQSVIHSMVAYADGSVLAQMGAADMRTPITYALGFPNRLKTPGQSLDIQSLSDLTFQAVDERRFPAVKLAYDSLNAGQATCIALNAANEVAVEAFLDGRIGFLEIVETTRKMLEQSTGSPSNTLDDILAFDRDIRAMTLTLVNSHRQQKHA